MKKFFLVVVIILPTLLTAQNGIVISNFSVSGSTITLDLSWKSTGMPTLWLDSAWVFVDYNNAGVMKRLPLAAGATLTTTSAPEVGKVIAIPGNTQGVWVVGNARTAGSFTATVKLPFVGSNVSGACAYASNYPPLGTWNNDMNRLTIVGTPPYTLTLQLKSSAATETVISGSPFILSPDYTLVSFTDKTGAPGLFNCTPPTAPESLTTSSATICEGASITLAATGGSDGSGAQFEWGTGTVGVGGILTSSNTYSVSPTATTTYWVRRVSTDNCGTSTAITRTVTVITKPSVPTPTIGGNTCAGTGLTFSATTPGGATGIEWTGAVSGTGSPKTTATTAGTYSAQVRSYLTVGTLTCNSAYSTATSGTVAAFPTINTQPVAATVCYNTGANLSVTATANTGTLTYQWYKNSVSMSTSGQAATVATGNLTAITPFYVVVGNTAGCSVTSNPVNVTARENFTAGAIATTGQTVTTGGTVTAISSTTAASGGDGSITYKWQRNSTDISGANAATYVPAEFASTTGAHTFTRWVHDGTCNTAWAQSSGSWVLTVQQVDGCGSGSAVTIGGVTWACANVDAPGVFASAPDQNGKLYKWNSAIGYAVTGIDNTYISDNASGSAWSISSPPCPSGWRVPSLAEFTALSNSGGHWISTGLAHPGIMLGPNHSNCNSLASMTSNCVFLPTTGWRNSTSGPGGNEVSATYWTNQVASTAATAVYANQVNALSSGPYVRSYGFGVRCVHE